jgi:hypothetical protein
MMASKSEMLTREEFASLLIVANTCAVRQPPAIIPANHDTRLIALGYMARLSGRLRMTSSGRSRIAAERELRQSGKREVGDHTMMARIGVMALQREPTPASAPRRKRAKAYNTRIGDGGS